MENNNIDGGTFSTRDLTLAATLITLQIPIQGIDFQIEGTKGSPIGYFKFDDNEELTQIRKDYTRGAISVEPKFFMTNVHSLKAEVANNFNSPMNSSLR